MNDVSVTYVTCYYDLGRFEPRPAGRDRANYMRWADFLFRLDLDIVFCVGRDDYQLIWSRRREYNLLHRTYFIVREFHELQYYGARDELASFRDEHPILNSIAAKDTPSYLLLTWNKMSFLEEVTRANPFGSSHFGWIDFGLHHVAVGAPVPENLAEHLVPDSDRIKMLELRPIFQSEVADLYEYTKLVRHKVAGGIFTGHASYLDRLFPLFWQCLGELLSRRIYAHEETVLALVYHHNRDLFLPYYGNYEQIICNYRKLLCPNDLVFGNIAANRRNRQHANALIVARKVYDDCYASLPARLRFSVLDELIVNAYYVDPREAEGYLERFMDSLASDPELVGEALKERQRMLDNVKFFAKHEEYAERLARLLASP